MTLYTTQSISGYNSSPPSDDGAQTESNRGTWDGVKSKLSDPVKTLSEAINTQLVTSFAGVGVEKISSGTLSAAAYLEIVGLTSSYFMYELVFEDLVPATDATTLRLRTSTDGGVSGGGSYDAGASDYAYQNLLSDPTTGNTSLHDTSQSASSMIIQDSSAWGTASTEEGAGFIRIYNPAAARQTKFTWHTHSKMADTNDYVCVGSGARQASSAVDAIQLIFSSGNIESMNYVLYGYIA